MSQWGTWTEVSVSPLLDTVAGAVPYWLLSSPKWHTKKCVAPPLHQLFLVNFPPVHHNQIPQGQAPTDQAPCWDFILLRWESLPTLSVPVHLSVCLSDSGLSVCSPWLPAFLSASTMLPHTSPGYQPHPTVLSLCPSSASEEHVWTRVPSEVRGRKKGT